MARIHSESIEQIKVVDWVLAHSDLKMFAIINQGKRGWFDASLLKRMGMRAGVSDLFIMRPTKQYAGCFLEMKTGKGKVSPEQQAFIKDAMDEGYFAIAVWNAETAIEVIKTTYDGLLFKYYSQSI